VSYDSARLVVEADTGRRLLSLHVLPDGTLHADYDQAELTEAALALIHQLRVQWAREYGPSVDDVGAPGALRRLFTDRAAQWWDHHVSLNTTMRVPRPDMVVLGGMLAALFPVVVDEHVGTPAPPRRWHRRLVACTGLHLCDPPPGHRPDVTERRSSAGQPGQ
jgi:hypothetical protein